VFDWRGVRERRQGAGHAGAATPNEKRPGLGVMVLVSQMSRKATRTCVFTWIARFGRGTKSRSKAGRILSAA
jgi:hypothetical protein